MSFFPSSRRWSISGGCFLVVWALLHTLPACQPPPPGEALARQHCGSCHQFPEPKLLDKGTWVYSVLPNMGRRLGMDHHSIFDYPPVPDLIQAPQAVLTQGEWEQVVKFYLREAPDSLAAVPVSAFPEGMDFFRPRAFTPTALAPVISFLQVTGDTVWVGDMAENALRSFDIGGALLPSRYPLESPPTSRLSHSTGTYLLVAGNIHPSEDQTGEVLRQTGAGLERVFTDLKRPVALAAAEAILPGGLLVCEFGYHTGRLSFHYPTGDGWQQETLSPTPGALWAQAVDLDQDGQEEVVALFGQAYERISRFRRLAPNRWEEDTLLQFPSVYGSLHAQLADMDGDGDQDLLYVNGDNGDYSPVIKPYHGLHVFENQGENAWEKAYFFPLPGAAQVRAADFDQDGQMDLVVTSNFAGSQQGTALAFLHGQGDWQYTPYDFPVFTDNNWNQLTVTDLDRDGDLDLLVGAMNLKTVYAIQSGRQFPDSGTVAIRVLENLKVTPSETGKR